MARIPYDYEDLPDGIVKLPPEDPGRPKARGCGLTGCLYGVVGLFVLLLAAMLLIALLRPWPAPPPMMGR